MGWGKDDVPTLDCRLPGRADEAALIGRLLVWVRDTVSPRTFTVISAIALARARYIKLMMATLAISDKCGNCTPADDR